MSNPPDNLIALYRMEDTDYDVLSQVLQNHPDRINTENINDQNLITPDRYNLCISRHPVANCHVPVLELKDRRIRVGQLIDEIESVLLQNRYGDISYGEYCLNWQKSTLEFDGKSIELTERERYLIAEILGGAAQGRHRDYLLNKIWGYRADLETHTLETHIYRLRQKIEDEPEDPRRLVTIDAGYKFS